MYVFPHTVVLVAYNFLFIFLFAAKGDADVQTNGGPPSVSLPAESPDPGVAVIQQIEVAAVSKFIEVAREEVKKNKEEKLLLFSKMFKKKAEPPAGEKSAGAPEASTEAQAAVSDPASDPPTVSEPIQIVCSVSLAVNKPHEMTKPIMD